MKESKNSIIEVRNVKYRILNDREAALIDARWEKGNYRVPDRLEKGMTAIDITGIESSRRYLGNLQVTDKRKVDYGEYIDCYTDEEIGPFEPELTTERKGKQITYSLNSRKSELLSIDLGKNIKHVCPFAFKNLGIKDLYLGSEMDYIPEGMCYGCRSLRSIDIPQKITRIERNAFANCDSLSRVFILAPSASISIDSSAFGNNTHLYFVGELLQSFKKKLTVFNKFKLNDNQRDELLKEGERVGLSQKQTASLLNSFFGPFLLKKKDDWEQALIITLSLLFLPLILLLGWYSLTFGVISTCVILIPAFFILRKKIKEFNPTPPMGSGINSSTSKTVELDTQAQENANLKSATSSITKKVLSSFLKNS